MEGRLRKEGRKGRKRREAKGGGRLDGTSRMTYDI